MLRLALLGDIHGNLEALNAVLEDMEKRKVDRLYCLGDLVGYGPDPEDVVKKLRELGVESIMGNYDEAVGFSKENCGCSYSPGREEEIGDISLNWTIKHTSNETKEYLRNLPRRLSFEVEGVKFLLVHGSPLDELFEYVKSDTPITRLKEIVSSVEEDIVVNGHTHIPMVLWVSGKLVMNPGSVGRPKDGDPRASYMVVEVKGGVVSYEVIKVPYDVKKVVEKIAGRGLPPELGTVLALGRTYDMGSTAVSFNLGL